ncbi:hypothetical protein SPAR72_1309 [Streptococcus pneumoniae GA41538]|nr:hypothetical protein SPAR72_1309 [Streptococcus pneumoniae GA41538]EHE01894.1 hypothetical protein SPAR43_1323 [Streptococcus pneumoniae GA17227]
MELLEKQAIDNKRKGVVGNKGKTTPTIAKASDKNQLSDR